MNTGDGTKIDGRKQGTPVRDLELTRAGDDGLDFLNLLIRELTRALVKVDVGLLEDHVGKTTANSPVNDEQNEKPIRAGIIGKSGFGKIDSNALQEGTTRQQKQRVLT